MIGKLLRVVLVAALAVVLGAGSSSAAPKVSVSITGSIDEMMPVLQLLRNMGFGFETAADDEAPIQLEVHSVSSRLSDAPPPDEPEPVAPLGLSRASVAPAEVAPGRAVTVTVAVSDPDGVVDTLGAALDGSDDVKFDLYDNGRHGDETPRDGVWTYTLQLPKDVKPGAHSITITAYDANGEVVKTPSPEGERVALTAQAAFKVSG